MRNNEYYNIQNKYDELYSQSKNKNNFYKLIEIITMDANIRTAYRNLKKNPGSQTPGTDGRTINDIKKIREIDLLNEVKKRINNYKPQPVKQVSIPKDNGKTRTLGIPTIWDRLIQQCILQVLEPICEPKFHNQSYGFRPNRGTHHAISRCVSMVNMYRHYYCVDIDIKGFFDNVDHGKLLKQIWSLGIRDKRLISIISKILKSEIDGKGIPDKGTPQGAIISPLLSNIVLNELDWWVSNQWETYKPNGVRNGTRKGSKGWFQYARAYKNMKGGFIIRYADDFKIMCRTYEESQRFFHATKDFLEKRLKLEISPEKSKVINMRKNSSNFLGFKIKVVPKGKTRYGYVAKTDMSKKAMNKAKENLKEKIKEIQHHTSVENINKYNATVRGIQNYYEIATNIYNNMTEVSYALLKPIKIRLKSISKVIEFKETSEEFQKEIVGLRRDAKIVVIGKMPLRPSRAVHHRKPMNFSQTTCNYTKDGRKKIHEKDSKISELDRKEIYENRNIKETIEFNDNCIAAFSAQRSKCYITGLKLKPSELMGVRKINNKDDSYRNIALIYYKLIPIILNKTYDKEILNKFNSKQKNKMNNLRIGYGLSPIL